MISVIVPTYNRIKELPKAVESILNQTYKDFELIIIDDGSTDDTEEMIKQYNDERIKYIKNTTHMHGASAARNIGIKESVGDYIAFNDSDDEWHPNKLEKQLLFLEQEKADVTFCMVHRDKHWIPDIRFEQKDCTLERILKGSFMSTPALFGKAECFKNCLFDEQIKRNVDWELVIRLIKGYKVVYQKENLVEQAVTKGSVSSDCNNAIASMNYILEKHKRLYKQYPKSQRRVILGLHYQIVLSKDFEYRAKMKERKSIIILFQWLIFRSIRYVYALRFYIDKN